LKIPQDIQDLMEGQWDKLSIDQSQALVLLSQGVDAYEHNHPVECYEPQDYQFKFHNAVPVSRIKAMFSANQTGKTYGAKMETSMHFSSTYPDWFKGFTVRENSIGRILVKDGKAIRENIEPALYSSIPRYTMSRNPKKNSQGELVKLFGRNNSSIDIVTHDMDTSSLEGWQGDYLWCDEPPPRDKWIACQRGLIRRNGFSYLSCTPLDQPWMYDDIYTNPNCFSITVDISQNKYLPKEAIERFALQLNEDEKEARLHGRFMHLSGLVYSEFGEAHLKESMPDGWEEWPKWQVIDPHTRKPFAIIYFAVDPMGRIWIYDEWPREQFHKLKMSKYTPQDYANIFNEMEKQRKIHRRIMDGRFCKQPMGAGGDSLLEIFDKLKYYFEPSYITLKLGVTDPGHLKLKEMLRISPVTAEPNLFVLRKCHNVIYSFQHNTWGNYRDMEKGIMERPSEFAKDFLDCIRYGLMDDPKHHYLTDYGRTRWQQDEFHQPVEDSQGTYGSDRDW